MSGGAEAALRARTELLVVAGSRAYGLHRPGSDVDVRGVLVAPAAVYHGFAQRLEQVDAPAEIAAFHEDLTAEERAACADSKLEGTVYELRKFVSLCAEANPNLLDVLFCRDEDVRRLTAGGRRLRAARDGFLSRKVRHTFAGYASAQLQRIRGHRKWLLDPPAGPPARAAFGLPETTLVPADHLGAALAAVQKQLDRWSLDLSEVPPAAAAQLRARLAGALAEIRAAATLPVEDPEAVRFLAAARAVGLRDDLIVAIQRERAYEAAARGWRQYREWAAARNPARAALEAAHGYDTKHAAHLVRLLRMGAEILTTGEVRVWRGAGGAGDAEELLAIRAGAWSYDALVGWAEAQESALDALADRSPLPATPDRAALDALCVSLVEDRLRAG